ncbi:PRC-barrel domain-containing protein [Pedomonas mirosovicensis]|uniref:PRC-barrel domain-containing protein n=1 Tax=Pedomonas mirosovicensis TaxID=2908641 RepID=UPI00286EF9F1|nr:PRC-barrel domain-containing protein [Pedomonas mirosovicensis]
MRHLLLVASAVCVLSEPVMAQGAQDTTSRRQDEAPLTAQDPPVPETPGPNGTRDYQTPAGTSPVTPGTPPGVPTPEPGTPKVPPGAPETPSRSPATIEPSAGIPQGYQPMEEFLKQDGVKRSQLVGRPVATLDGQQVGSISEFVSRDSRQYAHLTLDRAQDSPQQDVVISLDKLQVSQGSQTIIIEAQSRSDLEKLPKYDPDNFQTVR